MIANCPHCNTQYDFDESRIPPEGVTVKCTSCQNVFRVDQPSFIPKTNDTTEWMVRQTNGNLFKFRELTTLQKWIVERKVFRDDQISKTGDNWKRLGDIPELTTFFQVVENQATNTAPATNEAVQPSFQPPSGTGGSHPAYPYGQGQYPNAPAPNTNTYGGQPSPYPSNGTNNAPQLNQQWQQPRTSSDPRPGSTPDFSAYDDVEEDLFPKKKRVLPKLILITLIIICGGLGAFYYLKPHQFNELIVKRMQQLLKKEINPLAVSHYNSGIERLYLGSLEDIKLAVDDFTKALSLEKDYTDAQAALAEAYIIEADINVELARYELNPNEKDEAKQAEIKKHIDQFTSKAKHLTELAFKTAKNALALAPEHPAALRTMIDYYRHKDAIAQAKPLLDQAKQLENPDPLMPYVIGASHMKEATDKDIAIRNLSKALENQAGFNHARYFLALVYYNNNNLDQAKAHIAEILKRSDRHELALQLKALIEKPAEPEPKPEPEPKKVVTADMLLNKAERLRNQDLAEEALELYEKVTDMDEDNFLAHTGMGWCYIDMEYFGAAVGAFQRALRINNEFADAMYGLAEANRARGRKRDAVKYYRQFLQYATGTPEARVAERALKELNQ